MSRFDLSIIIPVYNEESTLDEILEQINKITERSDINIEVVVVDDGSKDNSQEILKKSKLQNQDRFTFISHKSNRGKGAAVKTGLKHVSGEYVVIQDADLEYEPEDIIRLYNHADTKNLDAVYGSRNLKQDNQRGPFWFYVGGRAVTSVSNFLFNQSLTDEPTCYKLIKREILEDISFSATGFEFCAELTAKLAKRGIKIDEIPISYTPRTKDEGKKIDWLDGVKSIWYFFKIRFTINSCLWLGGLVFLFFLALYGLTWHKAFYAYEKETVQVARDLLQGEYNIKRAGLGSVLLYLPFTAVFELFNLSDLTYLSFVPIIYSALSVSILYFILYHLSTNKYISLITSTVIGTTSFLWPYSVFGIEYATTFYLLLLLLGLVLWRKKKASLWIVGSIFGLLAIARSYGPVFGLPLIIFFLVSLYEQDKAILGLPTVKKIFELLLPAALIFSFALGLKYINLGSFSGAYSLAHEFKIDTLWTGFYGSLFSFGKGILFYSPLLFLVPFCLTDFYHKHRAPFCFILISLMLLLLINNPFKYWSDEMWSTRKLVPVAVLMHIPLISWFSKLIEEKSKSLITSTKMAATAAVIIAGIYIQIIGVAYKPGKQLAALRTSNLDSLKKMRYMPQLSHLNINNQMML
ncbi:MAG: glycosyltransferase family 2 protein, partial [Candidatus Magasanikbacteria bacterium]